MKQPLAFRVRPRNIDEIIGQEHIVGKNGFIRNCIANANFVNLILCGNPGCGKTSIAHAICESLNANYYTINATNVTKQEMIDCFKLATNFSPSIVIIDEIHQLDKTKQNILLPLLEQGSFFIIGTTTANPLISINKALRSRVHLLQLNPLTNEEIIQGLKRAIDSPDGLDNKQTFTYDALNLIAKKAKGDLRYALNIVEILSLNYLKEDIISEKEVEKLNFVSNYVSDKDENEHYNTISALQKSIRGSDVDAALYYLAKLIRSNDVEGITRRLLITAYEDVGLGNPQAVDRVCNAINVLNIVGLPEARIPLAFCVIDLCLSPKSNSAEASIDAALKEIENDDNSIREYLKLNPVTDGTKMGYPYGHFEMLKNLIYLPSGKENLRLYKYKLNSKYEQALVENYKKLLSLEKSDDIEYLLEKYKNTTN